MTDNIQKRKEKEAQVIKDFAQKIADMDIVTNINLTPHQLELLKKIHILAVNRALSVLEVQKDPRKISYYANDELKLGVVALLLTQTLINHRSDTKYTQEFLFQNISVYTDPNGLLKHVDFEFIDQKTYSKAIYDEIVYDWIIYRTPSNRGIKTLSDEKTFSQGLKNFYKGSSPVVEFSRFERKYFEEKQLKKKNNKESTEKAFRESFVKQVAEAAAKEILKNQDPMMIAKLLFSTQDYEEEIKNILDEMPIQENLKKINQNKSQDIIPFSDTKNLKKLTSKDEDVDILEIMSQIRSNDEK